MVDKQFAMSSYLALRYIEKAGIDFCDSVSYRRPEMLNNSEKIYVNSAVDIGNSIEKQLERIRLEKKKVGLLLSGGMDSAILASYLKGFEAYTFRFMDGSFQKDELRRAEAFSDYCNMQLHYVDIDWNTVLSNIDPIILSKGGPVHSIETQIFQAAKQAMNDGIDLMIIGDGSDYVFGGMDQLLSLDWNYDEFYKRYVYLNPEEVLKRPESINYLFERYRKGDEIDFLAFLSVVATEESYGSYSNAFKAAGMDYYDPYERLCLLEPLDLQRIRNGESKYYIRELFRMRFPEFEVPEKLPMPRPVDYYFQNWDGPKRYEFRDDIQVRKYTGNQLWQLWCLEYFLNKFC